MQHWQTDRFSGADRPQPCRFVIGSSSDKLARPVESDSPYSAVMLHYPDEALIGGQCFADYLVGKLIVIGNCFRPHLPCLDRRLEGMEIVLGLHRFLGLLHPSLEPYLDHVPSNTLPNHRRAAEHQNHEDRCGCPRPAPSAPLPQLLVN